MKPVIIGGAIALVAAILGFTCRDAPYRLRWIRKPPDQNVLAHRDSPYTNATWVVSRGDNVAELRFFDRVEGGVCLRPSWDEYAGLDQEGHLAHLAMPEGILGRMAAPDRTWPKGMPPPNPGTVPHSKYLSLFPLGVLFNERVMQDAAGAWRNAAPHVLIVGLGSGTGVAVLAHHFANASIVVVDIDRAVIGMVRDHYPLIRWLESADLKDQERPRTHDGRRRLELVTADARLYIRRLARGPEFRRFDLVILDAYTSGSTIPPHLMTREFYQDVAAVMTQEGVLLSNIIGSCAGTGRQHRVVGGAIRSMRAARLKDIRPFPYVHSFPVLNEYRVENVQDDNTRNNMVLASRRPLTPKDAEYAWRRAKEFVVFPDLPTGVYVTRAMTIVRGDKYASATVPLEMFKDGQATPIDQDWSAEVAGLFEKQNVPARMITDRDQIARAMKAVARWAKQERVRLPLGWDEAADRLEISQEDWVQFPRRNWSESLALGAKIATSKTYEYEAETLVGPHEEDRGKPFECKIKDAPLFTDGQANADIYNY